MKKRNRVSFSSMTSIGLHVLWAALFSVFALANKTRVHYDPLAGSNLGDDPFTATAKYAGSLVDPIAAASQLGRLDFVSILLTVIGILLAVGTFAGFWMVRREAIQSAEQEAREEVGKVAPIEIVAYFSRPEGARVLRDVLVNNPGLIVAARAAAEASLGAGIKESDADQIATANWEAEDVNDKPA